MKNTRSFFYFFALIGAILISGCVKQDFDEPPVDGVDPNLTANATISQIKALHSTGGFETITEDWIIEAIIVADDESGNFYKAVVIEDETAGINLLINGNGLHTELTMGRKVFIKCRGLVLSDYNGLIQIGGSTYIQDNGEERLSGIEEVLLNEFVFVGQRNQEMTPTVYTIATLGTDANSTLIQLDNVEFSNGDRGVTFADGVNLITQNLTLQDCNGGSILVRTSGYSTFANDITPEGNGTLVGIMSSFGEDRQLLLRNSFDLDMTGELCSGGGGGGGGGEPGECNGIVAGACNGSGDGVIDEDFNGQSVNGDVTIPGWCTVSTDGQRLWIGKEYEGNMYVQASAYNDSSPTMTSWLISETVDVTTPKKLNFDSAQAFHTHDGLSVWVSDDFNGDPCSATWNQLDPDLPDGNDEFYEFIPSGDLDLSEYSGEVNIAFRYDGSESAGNTGTFTLDNVVISNL